MSVGLKLRNGLSKERKQQIEKEIDDWVYNKITRPEDYLYAYTDEIDDNEPEIWL